MMKRSDKANEIEKKWEEEEKLEKRKKRIKRSLINILIIISIFLALIFYMHFIGSHGLVVREYKVESNNLPDSFHGFKVVHFSDLHYLTTINNKELKKIVNRINELRPDIVVFTGDLFDNKETYTKKDLKKLIDNLNNIDATIGLYAIKGNHDYNNDYFEQVINKTDFKILNNSYELIYYKDTTPIMLTGVGSILENDCDIDSAFSYDKEDNLYIISLIHEPDVIDNINAKYKVNLALAGHSHNGQIRLPGVGAIVKVEEGKKYPNKEYKINNTNLYVSGGLGTSIYEFRLFNKPSINLYRLVKEAK